VFFNAGSGVIAVNKERILALADLIEQQPHADKEASEGFTMSSITHDCGTPACIAGWAAWEAVGRKNGDLYDFDLDIEGKARDFLGISPTKADALFYPYEFKAYGEITPSEAAATLRRLAETGQVDWQIGGAA
jgi:hypothetical protein